MNCSQCYSIRGFIYSVIYFSVFVFLTGCATDPRNTLSKVKDTVAIDTTLITTNSSVKPESKGATGQLEKIALTPLTDLNLAKEDIPNVLLDAKKDPYSLPSHYDCAYILQEMTSLEDALGLSGSVTQKDKSLLRMGSDYIQNQGISAVKNTVEGAIPFRGWIRKLSGAEKYSKLVADSLQAGTIRRSYLKGIQTGRQDCQVK